MKTVIPVYEDKKYNSRYILSKTQIIRTLALTFTNKNI